MLLELAVRQEELSVGIHGQLASISEQVDGRRAREAADPVPRRTAGSGSRRGPDTCRAGVVGVGPCHTDVHRRWACTQDKPRHQGRQAKGLLRLIKRVYSRVVMTTARLHIDAMLMVERLFIR